MLFTVKFICYIFVLLYISFYLQDWKVMFNIILITYFLYKTFNYNTTNFEFVRLSNYKSWWKYRSLYYHLLFCYPKFKQISLRSFVVFVFSCVIVWLKEWLLSLVDFYDFLIVIIQFLNIVLEIITCIFSAWIIYNTPSIFYMFWYKIFVGLSGLGLCARLEIEGSRVQTRLRSMDFFRT